LDFEQIISAFRTFHVKVAPIRMILIVDDKQENLYSLKTLLQLHAYEVDTAESGEDALKKVLRNDYQLIILDVQMPGMDGFEVAETIAGYSKTKSIPILFLSAVKIDKRFISQGYAAGGVDYITKPFDPDLLMLKVRSFYRLSEQTRELKAMQESLKEEVEQRRLAQEALEELNRSLEDRVESRTKDLQLINQELERSNIELQQYASVASHDLQEPLRKIATFIDIIQERYCKDNEEAKPYIERIQVSATRMRTLINDLLTYSNLSDERQVETIDLNEALEETLMDLELAIKESGAVIEKGSLPKIQAMPGQFRQVFQNLLSNALKFRKQGIVPQIRIWSETDAAPADSDQQLRIYVTDNGIGFDETFKKKIFMLFQRLHSKEEFEGTGIGLAIVRKIIEQHGGTISASSEPGKGSSFCITLPLQQNNRDSINEPKENILIK